MLLMGRKEGDEVDTGSINEEKEEHEQAVGLEESSEADAGASDGSDKSKDYDYLFGEE